MRGVEAVGPRLGREGRIGDGEVERPQAAAGAAELRGGQRVAAPQLGRRVAVQDHVHPRQRPGGDVHLLAVDADAVRGPVGRLQQQRPGAAGRVVDGLVGAGAGADADHLRHDPRDLGRRVELPLALARLGGEVPHQVLVGVAQQVVAPGAVGAEVEALEDGDQPRQAVLHLAAGAEPALVVEVGLVDDPLQVVRLGQPADDLVDAVADLLVALPRRHVGEAAAGGHGDERVRIAGVAVRDVLHEQQGEDVVLVLRGVHAAAQLVAAPPEGRVDLRFPEGHAPPRRIIGGPRGAFKRVAAVNPLWYRLAMRAKRVASAPGARRAAARARAAGRLPAPRDAGPKRMPRAVGGRR